MKWPLVGREAELEFAAGVLAGDSARGLVVSGPAGVGKTRLAAELARLAESRGARVEWVRATRSAASIPLGAFAALLPAPSGESPGGADLLARARHALAERAGERDLVMCVDDGQLLDDASAALVHQIVASREAFAVVTLRHGEPVPDALRALWKDELCPLADLRPLERPEVERLLALALGGPVDGRTLNSLWELTLGNALFLRELVLHGLERGALGDAGGIWRWDGPVGAGLRLADLIGARLETLGPAERHVLELAAVGAPLEAGLLEPSEAAALDGLERHGMVELRVDGRRRFADLAHPLYGEAVRAQLTGTRLAALRTRLADAVEALGARRSGDLARLAAWRLESGGKRDPELFESAALQALGAYDFRLAERHAQAAVEAGGGFASRLALARALAGQGRAEEARPRFEELAAEGLGDGERVAATIAGARNLFWGLDRAAEADTLLIAAEEQVADASLRDELRAQRIRLVAAGGRPLEALAAARPLLDDPSAREQARLQAAVAATEALLSSGRSDEAIELAERWLPVAQRLREGPGLIALVPLLELILQSERAFALRFAGRLVEATEVSAPLYAMAVKQRSPQNNAVEAASLGYIRLARGQVAEAMRLFRESAALLRDADAVGMLPWALAGLAQAAAQRGEGEVSAAALAEMETRPLGHRGFEVELPLARAWSAAAAGELSRARSLAAGAAELAAGRGQKALELRALHELCRLGGAGGAAARLRGLADEVDGPLAPLAAAYAEALVAADGGALAEVAEGLAGLGALLVAAEAAGAAAGAYRDSGRAASARSAAARAAVLLEGCEGARPPTLPATGPARELTAREREVALLAAAGHSSSQIADRLVVSVRTVDNHLQRAYRKLGVSSRQDLAPLLRGFE